MVTKWTNLTGNMQTITVALTFGMAVVVSAATVWGDASVRSVRGEVVAVNVTDTPNVIVVKTMTGKNQELIVGATVGSRTEILRGRQHVSLQDIKVGESVNLNYVKGPGGLEARSIRVR